MTMISDLPKSHGTPKQLLPIVLSLLVCLHVCPMCACVCLCINTTIFSHIVLGNELGGGLCTSERLSHCVFSHFN